MKRKILVILSMITIFCIVMVFIFLENFFIDPVEETKNSLESRYNQKFTYIKLEEDKSTLSSKSYIFRSESGIEVTIVRFYDSEGNVKYRDNFLAQEYSDEISDMVSSTVSDYCERVEVDISGSVYPESTFEGMTVDELLSDEDTMLGIHLFGDSAVSDEDVRQICGLLYTSYSVRVDAIYECSDGSTVYFTSGDGGSVVSVNRE